MDMRDRMGISNRKENNRITLNFTQGCIVIIILYFVISGIFYYAAGEQLYTRKSKGELASIAGDYATPEITGEFTVRQEFLSQMDQIEKFSVNICTFARANAGFLQVRLSDITTQTELYTGVQDLSILVDGQVIEWLLPQTVDGVRGHMLSLELFAPESVIGNAVAPWYASTINTENQQLFFNGAPVNGTLCFATYGKDNVWTGPHYWKIMTAVGILLSVCCVVLIYKKKNNKKSVVLLSISMFEKYRFLIKQLVSRDFKIKYKRSVLGALWSFVNPLLTMSVQYVVFSTIFKTDVANYPVYLLSGIVLFNFFTEATNSSLYAIIGNASLITKVYVPKYIYPVSKVFSTLVNLLIALLPLLLMCLATGVRITKAWLMLPFDLICLLMFCIGMGFMVSAVMVFFRDMQFIWNVLSMVLAYATPVFYPESILPPAVKGLLKFNPMYQYITFFRTVIIEGISPEPRLYLTCIFSSVLFLVAGIAVFRKSQDKFIFYI